MKNPPSIDSSSSVLRRVAIVSLVLIVAVVFFVFVNKEPSNQVRVHTEGSKVDEPAINKIANNSRTDRLPAKTSTTSLQGGGKLSPVAVQAPEKSTVEGDRPAHWLAKPKSDASPVVPSGVSLSPPVASVLIGDKAWAPVSHGTVFERIALQPEQEIEVSLTWPIEHKISQVAVQAVHGGLVNGEVGQVLSVDKAGVFTFRFKPCRSAGHDEIVMSSGNVSFTMPIWVVGKNFTTPSVINP